MKRLLKKTKGLIRGVPSAVLLSAAIHLILLSVAGGLVVFTAIKKTEKKFVPPPPVERPKMELIKPKVNVKKNVKSGSTQRIVSQAPASMPDMQLPALEGVGKGLGSGIGGFDMMPDISEMGLFGGTKSMAIGNDFEGTFYSLGYDRRGKKTSVNSVGEIAIVKQFMDADWNPMVFSPYYRAPQKLYTTHFMIPPISTEHGPEQFGVDLGRNMYIEFFMLHYKGKIARKEGGRYRFWGCADNFMIVRVDKKIVFSVSFGTTPHDDMVRWSVKGDKDKEYGKYHMGSGLAGMSDWFELEPGVPVEMEVLMGDSGGWCEAMLVVEDASEDYPRNREGMPVLPIFKTEDLPRPLIEKLEYLLIRDEVSLNDPLKFNVY